MADGQTSRRLHKRLWQAWAAGGLGALLVAGAVGVHIVSPPSSPVDPQMYWSTGVVVQSVGDCLKPTTPLQKLLCDAQKHQEQVAHDFYLALINDHEPGLGVAAKSPSPCADLKTVKCPTDLAEPAVSQTVQRAWEYQQDEDHRKSQSDSYSLASTSLAVAGFAALVGLLTLLLTIRKLRNEEQEADRKR